MVKATARTAHERRRALGLELATSAGVRHTLFPFGSDRAFVVGSSQHADVRLAFDDVRPVEFHIERCRDELRLFPASSLQQIRVNGRLVVGSSALAAACTIEFSGQRIIARTLDATGQEPFEARQDEPSGVAYLAALPADNATTRLSVPVVTRGACRPEDTAHDLPTIVLSRETLGGRPPAVGPCGTEVLRREELVELPDALPPVGARALPPSLRSATTQIDVPVAVFQNTLVVGDRKRRPWLRRWRTLKNTRAARVASVALLGVAAFAGCLVAVLHLVPPRGVTPRDRANAPTLAHTVARRAASAPPSAQPSLVHSRPDVATPSVVVVTRSSSRPVGPDGAAQKPLDPEHSEAIEHLFAGRDVQAKTAYERLSARFPEEPAFSAMTHLLERLASPGCTTVPTPVSCPVVKR